MFLGNLLKFGEQIASDLQVKYLRNHLSPAMDEINPTIFDMKVFALLLFPRLMHEIQSPPVIELPRQTPWRVITRFG
jgi:hypothetical protein